MYIYIYIYMYVYIYTYMRYEREIYNMICVYQKQSLAVEVRCIGVLGVNPLCWARWVVDGLTFTRDSFTSRLLCTNQPCFHSPLPSALPTMVQYYCACIGHYKSSLTVRLYAIHHAILVIPISCKGQLMG